MRRTAICYAKSVQLLFSTVVRGAPVEAGGDLVRLDRQSGRKRQTPLAPREPVPNDPNPRGNTRGGRGILVIDGIVHVATYHSIERFDTELRSVDHLTHPLFVGLHEVCFHDGAIWAAATALDAAVAIRPDGSHEATWWARDDPVLQQRYGVEPQVIDKTADNRLLWLRSTRDPSHLHLNALTFVDGHLWVLLNRVGAVYDATDRRVIADDVGVRRGHNLVPFAGGVLVNDTHGRRIVQLDRGGKVVRAVDVLQSRAIRWEARRPRLRHRSARPVFVRGLAVLDADHVVAGMSPASLVFVNMTTGVVEDVVRYSRDVEVCVHGLATMPDDLS
jgi:hypothetical protein